MSIYNPCFEEKYVKYQNFLSENFQSLVVNFQSLVVNFSVYLNRHAFVMNIYMCGKRRHGSDRVSSQAK